MKSRIPVADGEATETQVLLDFARDSGYLTQQRQVELTSGNEEVGNAWKYDPKPGEVQRLNCVLLSASFRLPSGGAHISWRFASALSIVTSSTYSRSLPTGIPIARRVTRRPKGLSRRLM
jgi:hypothetical protein